MKHCLLRWPQLYYWKRHQRLYVYVYQSSFHGSVHSTCLTFHSVVKKLSIYFHTAQSPKRCFTRKETTVKSGLALHKFAKTAAHSMVQISDVHNRDRLQLPIGCNAKLRPHLLSILSRIQRKHTEPITVRLFPQSVVVGLGIAGSRSSELLNCHSSCWVLAGFVKICNHVQPKLCMPTGQR